MALNKAPEWVTDFISTSSAFGDASRSNSGGKGKKGGKGDKGGKNDSADAGTWDVHVMCDNIYLAPLPGAPCWDSQGRYHPFGDNRWTVPAEDIKPKDGGN